MADEATALNVSSLDIRQVTVADGTAIPKGTLLVLASDANTATAHSSGTDTGIPIGIACAEKKANDGATTLGAWVRGDFDMVADGAITLGSLVLPSNGASKNNRVEVIPLGSASIRDMKYVLGRCLETADDAEKVRIRLMLG